VRASSSFLQGAQCVAREPFDLIILDQGCGKFEGRKVLAQAMQVDVELRLLGLARSYARGCSLGEPDDIGWGIVYIASEESKFVTGSELIIDGDYTAQ